MQCGDWICNRKPTAPVLSIFIHKNDVVVPKCHSMYIKNVRSWCCVRGPLEPGGTGGWATCPPAIQAKPFTYKCPSITFPFPTRFLDLLTALVLCYFSQSLSLSSLSDFQFWCFSVGICKYKPGYKSHDLLCYKFIALIGWNYSIQSGEKIW